MNQKGAKGVVVTYIIRESENKAPQKERLDEKLYTKDDDHCFDYWCKIFESSLYKNGTSKLGAANTIMKSPIATNSFYTVEKSYLAHMMILIVLTW